MVARVDAVGVEMMKAAPEAAKILLVDDEPESIKLISRMLAGFGQVCFATSALEALERIRADAPDLVITDIHMPGMSGLEMCDLIRSAPELRHLPVMVITALGLGEVELAALQRGAADFVTKPLEPESFVARVRAHLRSAGLTERISAGLKLPPVEANSSPRLLVVDDEVDAIQLVQRSVAGLGVVHFATSGSEALRLAHELDPDLVLLDANMPGLDGFGVCAALKSQERFAHLPIVFVTRHSDVANERQALDLGAADFVSKPYDPQVLRARVRNLLELKRRQDAELRAATEHWRRLADSHLAEIVRTASDAIVSCNEQGEVVLANAAAAQMFGCAEAELIGAPADRLLPGLWAQADAACAGPVGRRVQRQGAAADRPVEIRASRSAPGGLTTFLLRDCSEREQLIAEQQARSGAEAVAQARARLMAYVSHEMGAPLNAILGFAQILAGNGMADEAQNRRQLQRILEGAEQLQGLIADLLEVSRQAAGQLSVQMASMELGAVVQGCVDALRPAAERGRVVLRVEGLDEPLAVRADAKRVRQCISNLVSNAIKYSPQGGVVQVRLFRSGTEACVMVKDEGPGLSEAQLAHLFEPFNRLGAESTSIPGTGLGLVISKGFAEAMGGRLEVWSEMGSGSRFSLFLHAA